MLLTCIDVPLFLPVFLKAMKKMSLGEDYKQKRSVQVLPTSERGLIWK